MYQEGANVKSGLSKNSLISGHLSFGMSGKYISGWRKLLRVAHRCLEKKMYQVTERIKKVEESGNARGKVICNPR